jgi:DNA polymerase-3 subunit beta
MNKMKVSLLQENLREAVGLVSRWVARRPEMAVLSMVLIKAEKGGLIIEATDLQMGIRVEVGGKVEQEGGICAPSRILGEVLSNLSPGKVELEVKGKELRLKTGKSRMKLNGVEIDEWPSLSVKPGKNKKQAKFEFGKKEMQEIIKKVVMAASGDESRPVLQGVKLSVMSGQGEMEAVATDGYRLAYLQLATKVKGELSFLVPARFWLEIVSIVEKMTGKAGVMVGEGQIGISFDGVEVWSRLLSGNFPDYKKVMPTEFESEIETEREDLVAAVRLAGVFAKETAGIVKINVKQEAMEVSANAMEVGENITKVEIRNISKARNEELEIAVNYRYLLDGLMGLEQEKVRLKFNGALKPVVLEGAEKKEYRYLVMPVRVQK